MYDCVVVGARCAGAAVASSLARLGYRVLMVDRAAFPSDTMSTSYLQPPGVVRLRRRGLLESVLASGCPPLDSITYQAGDVRLHAEISAVCAPRRTVLDRIMVEAAVRDGAEFADRCTLTGLLAAGGRVTGVRLRDRSGARVVPARLVVGADGMRSSVAQLVGAATRRTDPRLSCVYYSGWTGLSGGFAFAERPGAWLSTIPTHDGVTLVATYLPQCLFAEVRRDPFAAHLATARSLSAPLADELAVAEQTLRLRGTGDQRNFLRQANGPGWVLVGDAAHHLDSITAYGITNALVDADLLAEEIEHDLRDEIRLDAALNRYARRGDEQVRPGYLATLEVARLALDGPRLDMLRTISRLPELTRRYFAVVAGELPMAELLTPELAELI